MTLAETIEELFKSTDGIISPRNSPAALKILAHAQALDLEHAQLRREIAELEQRIHEGWPVALARCNAQRVDLWHECHRLQQAMASLKSAVAAAAEACDDSEVCTKIKNILNDAIKESA